MAPRQLSARRRRRPVPSGAATGRRAAPLALVVLSGLLLLSLPLLLPACASGERLKIRRELRKF